MDLQSNYTMPKGNLIDTHSIHHVIWKNGIHEFLSWNLAYSKFTFAPSLPTKENDKTEQHVMTLWKIFAGDTQFKQLRKRSLKKIQASAGFEPVTSAIPVQCSTNWAMKP